MNAEHQDAGAIFPEALRLTAGAERRAYLDRACAGNPALRAEVESLLCAHEQAGDFLRQTIKVTETDLVSEKAGTMIGRYKLLEQIGEGGFGVVWMAEQEEPVRRRVALKIIKLGMDTREVVARFEAERQALAMMDHPNIASVFDGGATATGRPYFVMELVKGIPITQFCDERKLSMHERLGLFMQVCQAVQHAHQKGVIHRDLKPSNVLVTVKDDRPVPKVIDFGVAKATQARLTEKTLFTRFHQWIGTPAYMSPEQAGLGSLDVDTRSDVYSLGVLLYELLTGRAPFDMQKLLATGYDAVMRTIREDEPPKPSTRLSTLADDELNTVAAQRSAEPGKLGRLVRGDLDWIVMKALEKDRVRRYDTAASLAQDVERHLHAKPVSAAAPDFLYLAGKFIRRHRTRLAFAGLALTVVTLAAVGGKFALNYQSASKDFQATSTNAVFNRARSGDATALARLLDANPLLVNQRDAEGSTPLIYAAGAGNTNTLSLLTARGAAVDATNHSGLTALGNATGNNRTAAALILIAAGADPNQADASGLTPLHSASMFGAVEVGRALLAKGARTEVFAQSARLTPLSQAAMVGHADFVDLLLAHRASVETRDPNGHTPLHFATSGRRVTDLLVAWKAEVEKLSNRHTGSEAAAVALQQTSNRLATLETSLPAGSLQGGGDHRRVAGALLAHGAALEATNRAGRTPLGVAAQFTNEAVAQVLIAHQANLNVRDANGLTPLHVAAQRENPPMVKLLLDAGADPNLLDEGGFTPLNTAVEHDQRAVAEMLLAHRADPNLALSGDKAHPAAGQTPLHTAAMRGNVELLGLLLGSGAFINVTGGRATPLCWAVEFGRTNAIDFLLKRGAVPNVAGSKENMTPLHWAALLGLPDATRKLLDHGASNNAPAQIGMPLHAVAGGPEGARKFLETPRREESVNGRWARPVIGSSQDYRAVLKLLLDSGADVNARDPLFESTPLFTAARYGNLPAVEALLAAGADVMARGAMSTTPLHVAPESSAPAAAVSNIVVRLLKAGADPSARDSRMATPLHAAANAGRPEVAALLIAAGARVNAAGPDLATPLQIALARDSREVVELLLAKGADLEWRNRLGQTALHVAMLYKSRHFVTLLLQRDADANATTPNGTTPLMMASEQSDTETFHLLLAHEAKLDAVNQTGFTLLHAAAAGGSMELVNFVLDHGAKFDRGDREGNTPAMTAAKYGQLEVLKFFLEHGASLKDHDNQGFTLLHGAADHAHLDVVEYLLGRGLDANARSDELATPLHYVANAAWANEAQYVAVANVLLAHGAEVNAQAKDKHTPLHRAAYQGRLRVMETLLEAKADPNAHDSFGKTSSDWAVQGKHAECADRLRKAAADFKPSRETQAPKP